MKHYLLLTLATCVAVTGGSLCLPLSVLAAPIVYQLANTAPAGWSITGTITTNGKIGLLETSDIIAWSYSVDGPSPWSDSSTDPLARTDDFGQLPSVLATEETITISGEGYFGLRGGESQYRYMQFNYPRTLGFAPGAEYYTWINNFRAGVSVTFATGGQVIPEPSTALLLGLGLVLLRGCVSAHHPT